MELENLGPAERLAAGAIGLPGSRRFFLEVTAGGTVHSFACEKSQVAELAEHGQRLLIAAGMEVDNDVVQRIVANGLDVSDPEEARFRIGSIGISIDRSQFVTVTLGSVDEDQSANFVVTTEQFRAMALVASEVVAAGRPICPRCQLPEDPEDHRCPSVNGHHG